MDRARWQRSSSRASKALQGIIPSHQAKRSTWRLYGEEGQPPRSQNPANDNLPLHKRRADLITRRHRDNRCRSPYCNSLVLVFGRLVLFWDTQAQKGRLLADNTTALTALIFSLWAIALLFLLALRRQLSVPDGHDDARAAYRKMPQPDGESKHLPMRCASPS